MESATYSFSIAPTMLNVVLTFHCFRCKKIKGLHSTPLLWNYLDQPNPQLVISEYDAQVVYASHFLYAFEVGARPIWTTTATTRATP